MNQGELLRLEMENGVARVTLNRPRVHNAFDERLVEELHRTADALAGNTDVRVAVLTGEGKSFCAGADLNWMKRMVEYSTEENLRDAEAMARMFEAWHSLPKPVVGRVQGAALGGGVGLVAVCDVAVASSAAVFGFTEVRLGILPAVISPFVLAKIGPGPSRELFLTGERFSAERARSIGLVQHVADPEALDHLVGKVLNHLKAGGPEAQARTKRLLAEIAGQSPETTRSLTAQAIAAARASTQGQDGIRAFLERREPSWRKGS